jgi:lysophosphatidylcholine acyltransferase/lyso-PAF acetyltransferase
MLFPEGTTTTGNHILKFKKGAFSALLPIKPVIITIDQTAPFHIAVGVRNVVHNFLCSLSYLNHDMYVTDLPVIAPTNYMFEKYADLGKEKWEIYAEVVRRMYCEIGHFTSSDQNTRDSYKYMNALYKGVYIEDEKKDK